MQHQTVKFECRGTEFSFQGFDAAAVMRMERSADAIQVTREQLLVETVHDVEVIPPVPRSNGRFSGGAFSRRTNKLVETARVARAHTGLILGGERREPSGEAIELSRALYGGMVFSGFGHVILESINRLWAASLFSDIPILMQILPNAEMARESFLKASGILGIDADRYIFASDPVHVSELLVPEPGLELGIRVNSGYLEQIRALARSEEPGEADERLLYLSRSRLSERQRKALNEKDLEAVLSANHVEVCFPETSSLPEQIRRLNCHARIAGNIGSQFHTLIFREGGHPLDAIYLGSEFVNLNFIQIDLTIPGKRLYANVATYAPAWNAGNRSPFRLNMADSLLALRQIAPELDVTPARSSLPVSDDDYIYRWAYNFFFYKVLRKYVLERRHKGDIAAKAPLDLGVQRLREKFPRRVFSRHGRSLIRAYDAAVAAHRCEGATAIAAAREKIIAWSGEAGDPNDQGGAKPPAEANS